MVYHDELDILKAISIQRPNNKGLMHQRALAANKLRFFFGRRPPVDASLDEILAGGLPVLLESNVPLSYFLICTMKQMCSESLFFYLEVHNFQNRTFSSHPKQLIAARRIYHAFLATNSEFEINVNAKTKIKIRKLITLGEQLCFDEAVQHVVQLLQPAYLDFLQSQLFKDLSENIDGMVLPYTQKARKTAVNILVSYLDEFLPIEPKADLQTFDIVTIRNYLLRGLVHQFCRRRLGFDFYDTNEISRVVIQSAGMRAEFDISGDLRGNRNWFIQETDISCLIFPQKQNVDIIS